MKYEHALRMYDAGWIIGIITVFGMRYMTDNDLPLELAFAVGFLFLGIWRWIVESLTAPKKEAKKENKNEEKKENNKNERK